MQEQTTTEKIESILKRHEKDLRTHYCGDQDERVASLLNHYERTAAQSIAERKKLIEDVLVYFRSVVMITESIGMASTHAEKGARWRGLIELLNGAIEKLKKEQTEDILNNWHFFNWDYSAHPYESILRKFDDVKRENEELKKQLSNGKEAEDELPE